MVWLVVLGLCTGEIRRLLSLLLRSTGLTSQRISGVSVVFRREIGLDGLFAEPQLFGPGRVDDPARFKTGEQL